MGEQRRQLTLKEIYEAYNQRYDLEHFFRFGKQKLLLDAYQTPETRHEENWWELAHIAYLLLVGGATLCQQLTPALGKGSAGNEGQR